MSKNNNKKSIPIKISKTSSARPLFDLHLRHKSEGHQITLEEAENEDKLLRMPYKAAKGDYDGKAYRIMRLITENTGIRNDPVGNTVHHRLVSMKIDPALKVLENQTWREFFEANSKVQKNGVKNPKEKGKEGTSLRLPQTLEDNFYQMVNRVENFWEILKIPMEDRKFYKKALLKGPPQSLEHCREVADYILLLREHQISTIDVLGKIEMREIASVKHMISSQRYTESLNLVVVQHYENPVEHSNRQQKQI